MRLSDPVLRSATGQLTEDSIGYSGPGPAALERCYDKYAAWKLTDRNGILSPQTRLASDADENAASLIIKPRRGSDSIGVRRLTGEPVPRRLRKADLIVQQQVSGSELTVALIDGLVGHPLEIQLPAAAVYTFWRKYLLRPDSRAIDDTALADRVRAAARETAKLFRVDWAVRIDFVHDRASGQLYFLECDAAPLIGKASAFARSLTAAGIARSEQLDLLVRK